MRMFKRIAPTPAVAKEWDREKMERDFPPRDGRPSLRHENLAFSMDHVEKDWVWDIVRIGKEVIIHDGPRRGPKVRRSREYETEAAAIEAMRLQVGRQRTNGWVEA